MFSTSIGRKIVMAVTGCCMLLFSIVHLLGNSSIFAGAAGLNSYAQHLHSLPLPIIMAFRAVMLAVFVVHVLYGIQLTIENRTATPTGYAVKAQRKTTFASENMIWTGLLLFVFIVFHLLHFTFRVTPGLTLTSDAAGHFNVFAMVASSFSTFAGAGIYVAAMVVLFLHLYHGIQSFFQTMGWNCDCSQPAITKLGMVVALILLFGYVSIPLSIFFGILKG
ncbi:succinate dehydrogenase cytochrome b subunit [Trichlorobacter ammonificans]|uniref:Succinate dehydrogenase/fumarate reductase, cytochrome b558 subunit n=1 Tax=Trichlorobacter ammonificans TaxID=2916410 RepID=A0ABM9D825_9BACT|nr:succinate dehydrogenase cytochrome b subunit [Trichlorobacter ammonificans]CAH2030667.1 Succinate dehydrogenase/fumarate reductase, cytochrome b558 subunit [Trichlorobacter ammonificans]